MNLLEIPRHIGDFNPQKARRFILWRCHNLLFWPHREKKKKLRLAVRMICPYTSSFLFLFLLLSKKKKRAFIYRFAHSHWEGRSLFIPPLVLASLSPPLGLRCFLGFLVFVDFFGGILRCLGVVWLLLIAMFLYIYIFIVVLFSSLVNGRDGKKMGSGTHTHTHTTRERVRVRARAERPWKELAPRPPGLRVVLAARPAEWALSQTSVCSLLLESMPGWLEV